MVERDDRLDASAQEPVNKSVVILDAVFADLVGEPCGQDPGPGYGEPEKVFFFLITILLRPSWRSGHAVVFKCVVSGSMTLYVCFGGYACGYSFHPPFNASTFSSPVRCCVANVATASAGVYLSTFPFKNIQE